MHFLLKMVDFPACHGIFQGCSGLFHTTSQACEVGWCFRKPRVWTPLLAAAEMAHLDTLQVLLDVTLVAIKKFGKKHCFFLAVVHVSYSCGCPSSHGSNFVVFL